MSKTIKRASLVGLLALFLSGITSLGLPAPAKAQSGVDSPWRQLNTKICPIIQLSQYRPGKAFCNLKSKPGWQKLGLLDLNTGAVQEIPDLEAAFLNFLYEDAATGYILVLDAYGDLHRLDATLTQQGSQVVQRGPNDFILEERVYSAGYGTGVLFLRWCNFAQWFVSRDNGLTWEPTFSDQDAYSNASMYEMKFSASDPNVAYGLSQTVKENIPGGGGFQYYNYLYKSTDGGRTFSRIYRTPYFATEAAPLSYDLFVPSSPASPANQVYLRRYTYQVNYSTYDYFRSNDGGQTFLAMGQPSGGRGSVGNDIYLAPDGAVLQTGAETCYADGSCTVTHGALRSTDGGATFGAMGGVPTYNLEKFYLPSQSTHTYYALARQPGHSQFDPIQPLPPHFARSTNNGTTWETLPDPPSVNMKDSYYGLAVFTTDYAPLSLVVSIGKGDTSYVLTDPLADSNQARSVQPYPGQNFYPETQHNLGLFRDYWNAHGGLAQFGYPHTEVFREVNPSDGHIYPVQYFERARLEYHAEYKGTPYEVLLGLLGNQLTEVRRARGEGAFNRFDDMHYPGGTYFPQTGHNLRNSFKEYWEQHGGLAIYGYPTSEEFYEVNPDDGQTYVVQYFERNRFEYHPSNKGTPYEVLLGLLGNTLLKQKGWL